MTPAPWRHVQSRPPAPHCCAACSLRRRLVAEVVGYAARVALACALWSLRVVEGRRGR